MEAWIWGSRGSCATSGPDTVRYGGHTSCVEVRVPDGPTIILDAGTGLRELGRRVAERGDRVVHVLLSHLHLDHLQGLAFFSPLYDSGVELHVWGPPSPLRDLHERIALYRSEPLFPVNIADVPSQVHFHDAPEDGARIGPVEVWAASVAHQGPTVGYRLEHDGRSLVYIPDHEPAIASDIRRLDTSWISGYGLAAGADVLLHDSQYFEAEYPDHVGWGHSSIEHTVAFAQVAGVGQLVLFHHDPSHSDADLDAKGRRAAELWGPDGNPPVLAYDGMRVPVGAGVMTAAVASRPH